MVRYPEGELPEPVTYNLSSPHYEDYKTNLRIYLQTNHGFAENDVWWAWSLNDCKRSEIQCAWLAFQYSFGGYSASITRQVKILSEIPASLPRCDNVRANASLIFLYMEKIAAGVE